MEVKLSRLMVVKFSLTVRLTTTSFKSEKLINSIIQFSRTTSLLLFIFSLFLC